MNKLGINKERADEELETWIAQSLRMESIYIDDDGFTAGVMERLPAKKQTWSACRVLALLALLSLPLFAWLNMDTLQAVIFDSVGAIANEAVAYEGESFATFVLIAIGMCGVVLLWVCLDEDCF